MTVQTAVGTFTIASTATVGTTQAITCGFQPKAIIFWLCGNAGTTDTVSNATARYGMGVATGTTDRRAVASISVHNAATIDAGRIIRADACVAVGLNTGAVDGLLDISSLDANGFTVVVDDQFANTLRISYFAIGGDSITNAATGTFTCPTTTGNFDVTSLAFQPDFILLLSNGMTSDPPATSANRGFFTVGAAVSSTQRGVLAIGEGPEGNATSQSKSYAYDGEVWATLMDTPTTMESRANFVSFLSNGFRLNFLESGTGLTYRVPFLAIKGGNWAVGNLLTQTDTSTPIVESGFGFTPKGAMLFSHNMAKSTQDTVQANGRLSIGAFTDTSNRVAQALLQEDGLANTDVTQAIEHDEVYVNLNTNATVQGLMDVQSMDSDGFTLIMDDADPAQAFAWYFTVGEPSSGNTYHLTAAPAAASATPAVALTTDHKPTSSTTAVSNAVGTGSKIARSLTASPTAASNTAGGDLRVARKLTRTGTAASNTAGADLRVARKPTVTATPASNTATVGVTVARKVTATLTAASSATGTALGVKYGRTATLTAASNTGGAALGVKYGRTATATGATNTATVGVTVARKVTASLTAASSATGAALGVKYGRTATATGATNTATVGVTVVRKVTASLTGGSNTAGADLRVARQVTYTGAGASATAGADLRVLRRVTAILTAASSATGTELAVNTGFVLVATVAVGSATAGSDLRVLRKPTVTATGASVTAGGDLRVARRVTATPTAAGTTVGAALGVKYGRTATAAQVSNTAGGDLRILRRVTVNQTVVSVAAGAELTVQTGLTLAATVMVVSTTAGADLRIARRLTATVVGVSVTGNANLVDTQGASCQVHSTTGTATLAVNYRRQATVTVASGAWGNDLYRNLAYQVNGTVLSVTGDALFAATWAVFSDVQTVTPTPRLGLRLPSTSEALTQSDTSTGRLTVARALTVNRLAQTATALALVTVRRNLVALIPLVSESPVTLWRTLCLLDAACAVETPDVTADLWVARWLISVAVAAGQTPDAVLTYEEMLAQGRLQMQFSARGPVVQFSARGPVVQFSARGPAARFRVRGAPD